VDDEGTFAEWHIGEDDGASAGCECVFIALIVAEEHPKKRFTSYRPKSQSVDQLTI